MTTLTTKVINLTASEILAVANHVAESVSVTEYVDEIDYRPCTLYTTDGCNEGVELTAENTGALTGQSYISLDVEVSTAKHNGCYFIKSVEIDVADVYSDEYDENDDDIEIVLSPESLDALKNAIIGLHVTLTDDSDPNEGIYNPYDFI